jgi:O-antigen/teichoic acid export membrane protein
MRLNALALMVNVILSAALGYPFWLLAARLFDAEAVGLGAGATSAMRLSAQLALLGINAAVITMLPGLRRHASGLLSVVFSSILVAGLVVNSVFLVIASLLLDDMSVLARNPGYAAGFVALSLLWTVSVAIDAVLLAVRRADRIVVRSLIQGLVSIFLLAIVGGLLESDGISAILWAWCGALILSNLLGMRQMYWHVPNLSLRLSLRARTVRTMFAIGLPNYRLSIALLAQIWILPILVTETLGAEANAYWYAVLMFGVLVMVVPSASAQALFSQATNAPRSLNSSVRQSLGTSLLIGLPMAASMALLAGVLLSIMGSDYAEAGTLPLRIVALGVLPRTFIETYVAVKRATRDLTEPAVLAGGTSILALAGAAIGALGYGLEGVAAGWLIAQCLGGALAAWRLRRTLGVQRRVPSPALAVEVSRQ